MVLGPGRGVRISRGRAWYGVAAAILMIQLGAPAVRAQSTEPSDGEVSTRLAFIQEALDAGRAGANRWWYGWLAAYTAGTAGQALAAAASTDESTRQDLFIGAATSALGAAGQVVFPLQAGRFASRLRALPGDTAIERRAKLRAAERFLKQAAREESYGRSWKSRLLSLSVNAAAGLTTSVGFNRPAIDGVVTFGIGQAISELQLFSQPMRAAHDYERYTNPAPAQRDAIAPRPHATWSLAVAPAGFRITRTF